MAKKKDETVETETEVKPVFISQESLREVDKVEAEIREKRLMLEMQSVKIDRADKELTLLSANYTLKSKEKVELQKRLEELKKELEEKQNKYKDVIKDIASAYGLPDKFGYDHITGEVK